MKKRNLIFFGIGTFFVIYIVLLVLYIKKNKRKLLCLQYGETTYWTTDIMETHYGCAMKLVRFDLLHYKAYFYHVHGNDLYPLKNPLHKNEDYVLILKKKPESNVYFSINDIIPDVYGYRHMLKSDIWSYNPLTRTLSHPIYHFKQTWKEVPPFDETGNRMDSDPVSIYKFFTNRIVRYSAEANTWSKNPITLQYQRVGEIDTKTVLNQAENALRIGNVHADMSYGELCREIIKLFINCTDQHAIFQYFGEKPIFSNNLKNISYSTPVENWIDIPFFYKNGNATFNSFSGGNQFNSRFGRSSFYPFGIYQGTRFCLKPDASSEINIVADNYLSQVKRLTWDKDENGKYIFSVDDFNNPTNAKYIGWPFWFMNGSNVLENITTDFMSEGSRNCASPLFFGIIRGNGIKPFGDTFAPFGVHSNIHGDVGYVNVGTQNIYAQNNTLLLGENLSSIDNANLLLTIWDYFRSENIKKIILDYSANRGGKLSIDTSSYLAGAPRIAYIDGVIVQNPDYQSGPTIRKFPIYIKPQDFSNKFLTNARITIIQSSYSSASCEQSIIAFMGENFDGILGNDVKVTTMGQNTVGSTIDGAKTELYRKDSFSLNTINPNFPTDEMPLFGCSNIEHRILGANGYDLCGRGIPPMIPYQNTDTYAPIIDPANVPEPMAAQDLNILNCTWKTLANPNDPVNGILSSSSTTPDKWRYGMLDSILSSNLYFQK